MAESYLKDAFFMPPNLIGLGVGAAVSVLFGLPVVFLGVAALEGVYLWQMSTNPRFQRLIRSRRR